MISFKGQFLVAMPEMGDERFRGTVIYMVGHGDEGAMGLVINQPVEDMRFIDVLEELGISQSDQPIQMPDREVLRGGPVQKGRGFVLHSPDYFATDSTLTIDDGICLTATVDILKAIANGEGPLKSIFALGYSGWSPGQLESEIHANGWLHCPADVNLVFDPELESKYARAMAKIGIDPSHLVADAGHA